MIVIAKLCLWFFVYSFLGWLYETIICSVEEKHLTKRGFLIGPYCPIYGVGAFINIISLSEITNPVLLFITGLMVAGFVEYFTGNLMEKIFHARWWDYSGYKFNLHGHICLYALVIFGAMATFQIKYFQPALVSLTTVIPTDVLLGSVFFLTILGFMDIVVSLRKRLSISNTINDAVSALSFRFTFSSIWMAEKVEAIQKRVFYSRTD